MKTNTNILLARKEDLPLLEKFLPAIEGRHEFRLGKQLKKEGQYLIYWENNIPIGCLLLEFNSDLTLNRGETSEINVIYVAENQRSRGIAEKLLNEAISISQNDNCKYLCALVSKGNEKARSLYKKFNFVESGSGEFPGINKFFENGRFNNQKEIATYLIKYL